MAKKKYDGACKGPQCPKPKKGTKGGKKGSC